MFKVVHPGYIFYPLPSYQGISQPEVEDIYTLSPLGQEPTFPKKKKAKQMR